MLVKVTVAFLGGLVLTAIFMALYAIVIAVVLVIIVVGQVILWPIVEALKIFSIFNKIVNGYYYGWMREYKHATVDSNALPHKETNDKTPNEDSVKIDIPSGHHQDQDNLNKEGKEINDDNHHNNNNNDNDNNDNRNNNDHDPNKNVGDEDKKGRTLWSLESLSSLSFIGEGIKNCVLPSPSSSSSTSTSQVQEIFSTEHFFIPPGFFEEESLYPILIHIWWFRLKKILIYGMKWNILLLYPLGYLLVFLPDALRKYIFRRYECCQFFWYQQSTSLENPDFQ